MKDNPTPEDMAKQLVDLTYQPLGYLNILESSRKLWAYASIVATDFIDKILNINENPEEITYWKKVKEEIIRKMK